MTTVAQYAIILIGGLCPQTEVNMKNNETLTDIIDIQDIDLSKVELDITEFGEDAEVTLDVKGDDDNE